MHANVARKRGRPAFAPTAAQRRQVSIAAGGGMRHVDIATALGIARDTLEKHFEAELSGGAIARRMEVLQALHAAAKKGSSSAARAYLQHEATPAVPPLPVVPAAGATKAEPIGKKAQANADAVTAARGTEWDSLLSPGAPVQ